MTEAEMDRQYEETLERLAPLAPMIEWCDDALDVWDAIHAVVRNTETENAASACNTGGNVHQSVALFL